MFTILCIDDDPRTLELEKNLLEMQGYAVLTASDGPAGVALARAHRVDAVVLDFKMPGMDGDRVMELLLKEQPDLPVVIRSGFPYEVPEWLKWFATAFLHKGDGPKVLLSAVQELITRKKISDPVSPNRVPSAEPIFEWSIVKSHSAA